MGNVLTVSNLSIQIKQKTIIQNVSFEINSGDAVLLSGANGMGKSTILSSIMGIENDGKKITGEIIYSGLGDLLSLNKSDLQKFRSSIAYVPQKDKYAEMGRVQVRDIISDSGEAYGKKSLNCSEVNEIIDEWIPRKEDNSRVFDAKDEPAKFSGGEQRLLSVLSTIVSRPDTKLMIIDEPLNNLDFINARNISNLINKVFRDNPEMGLLMISHCRIFPFINREIRLTSEGVFEQKGSYVCHSCFGDPNEEGYY